MRLLRNKDTSYSEKWGTPIHGDVGYAELDERFALVRFLALTFDEDKETKNAVAGSYVNLNGSAIGTLRLPTPNADGCNLHQTWLFVDEPICRVQDVDLVMRLRYIDDHVGHFVAEYEGLQILDINYPRFHGDEWHTEEEWDLFYQLAHHRR